MRLRFSDQGSDHMLGLRDSVARRDRRMKIIEVRGREILDSRGNPTVEVEVTLEGGGARARRSAVGRVDRRA